MIAIRKIIEFSLRVILVIYGLVDLLGVFWFIENIYISDFVRGIIFSLSALSVGLLPEALVSSRKRSLLYAFIGMLGVSASLYLLVQYIHIDFRGWEDVVEQLVLIFCFLFIVVKTIINK